MVRPSLDFELFMCQTKCKGAQLICTDKELYGKLHYFIKIVLTSLIRNCITARL
jgi:hypothetical protein